MNETTRRLPLQDGTENHASRQQTPSENLAASRAAAAELLAAGDEAIRKALSKDSERFLGATRQSGGQ